MQSSQRNRRPKNCSILFLKAANADGSGEERAVLFLRYKPPPPLLASPMNGDLGVEREPSRHPPTDIAFPVCIIVCSGIAERILESNLQQIVGRLILMLTADHEQ